MSVILCVFKVCCLLIGKLTTIFPNFLGFSVGSNRSFSILGLLGACTVCRCNQRHSPWKMAVFLMCLIFWRWTGFDRRSQLKKQIWSQQRGLRNFLEYIGTKRTGACGLIILFLGEKCTMWQHNISQPCWSFKFSANAREIDETIVQKLLTLFFSYS